MLEGADEDNSVAHTAHNDASGTPINRKEEKYAGR
jgi:hypothetical protein